nr:transposase [Streptomyces sp. NBC_00830]
MPRLRLPQRRTDHRLPGPYGVALITPALLDTSRQAKAKEGFASHDFTIDRAAQQATCPAGHTSATWNPVVQAGVPKTVVSFAADCIPCPFKQQCTSAASGRARTSRGLSGSACCLRSNCPKSLAAMTSSG